MGGARVPRRSRGPDRHPAASGRAHRDRSGQCRDRRRSAPAPQDLARVHTCTLHVGHRRRGRCDPAGAARASGPGVDRRAPPRGKGDLRPPRRCAGEGGGTHHRSHAQRGNQPLSGDLHGGLRRTRCGRLYRRRSGRADEGPPSRPERDLHWLGHACGGDNLGGDDAPQSFQVSRPDRDHRARDLGWLHLSLGARSRTDADLRRNGHNHASASGVALPAQDDATGKLYRPQNPRRYHRCRGWRGCWRARIRLPSARCQHHLGLSPRQQLRRRRRHQRRQRHSGGFPRLRYLRRDHRPRNRGADHLRVDAGPSGRPGGAAP